MQRNKSRSLRTYRDPQWQKSDETEKKLAESSIYLANKRPYIASDSGVHAPTRIGTIFTGYLQRVPGRCVSNGDNLI